MYRNTEEWIKKYKQKNALWIHDKNLKKPHALLTSGMHSNGFFNSRLVVPDEELLLEAASDLLDLFIQAGGDISHVEGVVGPQTGATKLAELMCNEVVLLTGENCIWASPAKSNHNGRKSMVFSDEDREILPGQSVVLCEDVLTTGGSVSLAAAAVTHAGASVLPFVLVLVNRSGLTEIDGRKIVALIDQSVLTWTADECPFCKEGSEAVRPKDNWDRLNV